jgi:hypothetical protein
MLPPETAFVPPEDELDPPPNLDFLDFILNVKGLFGLTLDPEESLKL